MPRGLTTVVRDRQRFVIDQTPYGPDGHPVNPPTIPPA
jgi:hypothetical protein